MLNRIFPKQFDNSYRGHWLAIWLFALVVLLKATQGVESIINTRNVVANADGISLDGFSAAGVETFLALFAILGLYVLVIPLQSLLVLIRYRAMIPFMYLLLLILYASNRGVLLLHPIVRSAAPAMGFGGHPIGYYVNFVILVMTLIGFVLSLIGKRYRATQEAKTVRL